MKKVRVITVAMLVCFLVGALTIPTVAQEVDIEDLIDLYISDPAAGMDQLLELAETNPEAVALVLAGVAERAPQLESAILSTCLELVDTNPSAAALTIATIEERVPDMGERIETAAVGYGLEEDYLRAASPVRPS